MKTVTPGWYKMLKGTLYNSTVLRINENNSITAYHPSGQFIEVSSPLEFWGEKLTGNLRPMTEDEIFLVML